MKISTAERNLLACMPLHAITAVHGESGLRERLAIEIADFPPADRARIEAARWSRLRMPQVSLVKGTGNAARADAFPVPLFCAVNPRVN